MDVLKVALRNCYGIPALDHEFDFSHKPNKPKAKAYAIYAPNGLMKSSFAKTFEDLSNGSTPKEERYNRTPECTIEADGCSINADNIYVLKSEIDIGSDSPAITDILVNPENKARYDDLLVNLNKIKSSLIVALQRQSKVKKSEIEETIMVDFGESSLPNCIEKMLKSPANEDLSAYEYATLFDQKSLDVIKTDEFISKAREFSKHYQNLFEEAGTIYQRGVFNPVKAEASFSTLDRQGFFQGGHRVHLKGEQRSIDKEELDNKLRIIHANIDGDAQLKVLRGHLAKNAQTQALTALIEKLPANEVDLLIDRLRTDNQTKFRRDLWTHYARSASESSLYLESHIQSRDEILDIEIAAAQIVPRWTKAVERFNDRFMDMPFTLSVRNQARASLGLEGAKLTFTFIDGEDKAEYSRSEVKTLSQGEKRALYLLNFIFEVEARKNAGKKTIFIIDDAADSFDYKNKHAIIQYLRDLCETDFFTQIILTHNFDLFRSLANTFVHRDRCLMANRGGNSVQLVKAEAINNIFTKKWKGRVLDDEVILCASVPFTRNIVEYIAGESDPRYIKLTSLLHWKADTAKITVGDYLLIYNMVFSTEHPTVNEKPFIDLLLEISDSICDGDLQNSLNLEDKVLLSIGIRLYAEMFATEKLRDAYGNQNYWCESKNQFGSLMGLLAEELPDLQEFRILEKVGITVSSNIHLNSFMYEPILDLTIEHLVHLYQEVKSLNILATPQNA